MRVKIGVGIHDITGPCADIGFMGMSDTNQKGKGIHSRLSSRAFVIEDLESGKSVAIVCMDLLMCSQAMQLDVIKKLAKRLKNTPAAGIYTEQNVLLSATHTHSGPGGYSHYLAYNASISGFKGRHFDYIVAGVVESIVKAHNGKEPGRIFMARGEMTEECGGNRSLAAYENNPPEERCQYSSPQDKEMTLLKFETEDGRRLLGAINWFALHPTNMGQKNELVSGDNKGYAQALLEKEKGAIAAFGNAACGDISPNMKYGRPDGVHDFEHTKEYGEKMVQKAIELFDEASEELVGPLDYRQTYVDMSCCPIDGTDQRTWPAAFGYGMSKGSMEDSVGGGFWAEGTTTVDDTAFNAVNLLLNLASSLFGIDWPDKDDADLQACIEGQTPKPILFPAGLATYKGDPLVPSVLPLQLIRLGNLVLMAHPGELTTMAGRRLKKTVLDILRDAGVSQVVPVTYSGAYSSYTTTKEEYKKQYYEGASTLFGPHTLAAYQQENAKLARAMRDGLPVFRPIRPKDLADKYKARPSGVRPETNPQGADFGDVEIQPKETYGRGEEAMVTFWGANPNNNFATGEPYMQVEKAEGSTWQTIYTEKEFCTVFERHKRENDTIIEIRWKIPLDQDPGQYRIRYRGYWKQAPKKLVFIDALSNEFSILA